MQLQKEYTWLERQAQLEIEIQQNIERKAEFANPIVLLNPYGIAPLTALVLFDLTGHNTVAVRVYAQEGNVDFAYSVTTAESFGVPVYGLYAGCVNHVQLVLEDGTTTDLYIETEALPENVASARAEGTLAVANWMFTVPLADSALPAAYDKDGVCRWYCTEPLAYQISMAENGHLFTGGPALLSPPYSATAIVELDLLGKLYRQYRVPGGVCNGFFLTERGTILAIHQFFNRASAADLCIELDRETGAVLREWDLRKVLPMMKGGSPSQNGSDWFHANGVWYDKETDTIIISGKHQDIVVGIHGESGQLSWMLGDATNWPEELVNQYFLQPVGDGFEWFYEPSTVQMLANNQVLVFDNGHLRCKKGGTPVEETKRYSRVVCYQLNLEQRSVSQVWEYGKDAGNELYAPYLSSVLANETNQCVMNFGGIGWLDGKPAEPPAFFVQKDHPEVVMETKVVVTTNGAVEYQLQLPINCYYATALQVANGTAATTQEPGVVLGNWHGNDIYELDMEWEDAGLLAESYEVSAQLTSEQLILSGSFIQGEMVMLLLEGETERYTYYMQTTRAPYLTASAQTYAKGSLRPIKYVVDLAPLSGKYEICIGLDDKKYHTDLWFVCE